MKKIASGWLAAPEPSDEDRRLEILKEYEILDSEADPAYDRITSFCAIYFGVPIVLVSLIDANRQWFKSCVGIKAQELPRDQAFCAHAILEEKVLIILDALTDFRFKGNPLVTGEPYIRFYAGAPLMTVSGIKLGTLCLIDTKPRAGFSGKQEQILKLLARQISGEMELRSLEKLSGLL